MNSNNRNFQSSSFYQANNPPPNQISRTISAPPNQIYQVHICEACKRPFNSSTAGGELSSRSYYQLAISDELPPPLPPRAYRCNACKVNFPNAQAFGGHMSSHSKARKAKDAAEAAAATVEAVLASGSSNSSSGASISAARRIRNKFDLNVVADD